MEEESTLDKVKPSQFESDKKDVSEFIDNTS